MEDNNSLPALNLPVPLHTHFIKSDSAQQHNPHMQLRKVDGKPALVDTQIGLIRSLILKPNDRLIVDGAVLSADTAVGYLTPYSAVAKASSAGTTIENISPLYGEEKGYYSVAKSSLDEEIIPIFNKLKAAREILEDEEADLKAKIKAQQEIDKWEPIYTDYMARRQNMAGQVVNILNEINYIKKDVNGLMFDKAVDGVYAIQFENGVQVVIHDPAAAGWTYQTFAHYFDPNNGISHGYQSLGDETAVNEMPISGTATYKGISTAYLVNKEGNHQLTSKVTAVADFAKKGIRFATSDSQIHKAQNGIRVSTPADKYNLTGTAKWGNNENSFKGTVNTADNTLSGTLNGKFYGGASVAEIGGTYGLSGKDQQLIGGYGAKRQ
ncbi:hypothetical protein PL75_08000 [Neisseria arctica]|uniref:Transferrin-binding protein B C-lobe/N-lobe beta-barrel domain-containing protein n=1 Tax=Neisseria arctica TaxID=1470200 RepID=A0A0J1C2N6_9NEIS|nr:hypothetical protein PL75_08000 [Neisseria arctica]